VNQIPDRMLVKVGSTLLVPRTASSPDNVAEHIADGGQLSLAQESRPARRAALKAGRKGGRATAVVVASAAAPAKLKGKASAKAQVSAKPNTKMAVRTSVRAAARPPGPKARQTTRVAQR
jgi:membrane-bound lytic murein transglycosylase D